MNRQPASPSASRNAFAESGELVAIGKVRRPKGLRGDCHVEAFGGTLLSLSAPAKISAGRDPSLAREIILSEVRKGSKGFLCRFEGYGDADSAATLTGMYLFCGREKLPKLPEGSHYHFELEGLTVVAAESGRVLGIVTAVHKFPTVDGLEVRKEDGSTILVSLSEGVVRAVDKEGGVIKVSGSALEEII